LRFPNSCALAATSNGLRAIGDAVAVIEVPPALGSFGAIGYRQSLRSARDLKGVCCDADCKWT
jgi:hypothetical protein